MGEEEKRKRGRTVSEADKALKSPRLDVQTMAGNSLKSMGLQDVQVAPASPSDSSGTSDSDSDGNGGWCDHVGLDSEGLVMVVVDIEESQKLPTCFYPGCRITWKGAGRSKEGMMQCIKCRDISCAGWPADRRNPQGHARSHAAKPGHHVALWYDEPKLMYCFECECVRRLSDSPDNQDQSTDDECPKVDRKVHDDRGMVASKTTDQRGVVDSKSKVDCAMVASNSKADSAMLASNDQRGMVARDDASGYATGDGYVIRGMKNPGYTCYMNASLQCLLALGKLRTRILKPDTRLGDIGRELQQLFVETSSVNNAARRMLDPRTMLVFMQSLYPDWFKDGKMGDSHEFLSSLRNALDNEAMELNESDVKQGGEVFDTFGHSIFRGELTRTACISCSRQSVTDPGFCDLSLPLPSKDPPPSARSVAECGTSQIPGLELGDGAIEETPKPLQVDSCEVKDVVHGCLQTQKNDVPGEIIEMRVEALDSIPNLFDDTEDMKESSADSHNREDKEKAQSSDIVHDEAEHMNSLGSIKDCLALFFQEATGQKCENCSKVAELPETSGSKNVEPIMASTNVNTTVDGDQTELSDRKTCPSKRSSDFNSLLVESPSSQAYPSDSHHEVILSDDITTEEITSGASCDEKDLASCSKANEKAESHEGVQEAAPTCLLTDKQTDLLSAQDIQDISIQKKGSAKQVYDHSAQQVAEKQNKQRDGNGSAIKTQLISKLPSVLIIQLKRYTSDHRKLRGHVSFQEFLHLGPFTDPRT
ncbi:unnamed protein product [Alopecurus aequalis]